MKTSRHSDSQIMAILKQAEVGISIPELCREHGIGNSTFYKWRAKYGGMDASMMSRLKGKHLTNRILFRLRNLIYSDFFFRREMTMIRRSKEEWRALVNEQAQSGLTAVVFCAERELSAKLFSLRKNQLMPKVSPFVAVKLPAYRSGEIQLHWQGVVVHLPRTLSSKRAVTFI